MKDLLANDLDIIPTHKYYTNLSIIISSFIGGPLLVAYFAAANFRRMKKPNMAFVSWLIAIVALVYLGLSDQIALLRSIPFIVHNLIASLVFCTWVSQQQKVAIERHEEVNGLFYSWRRVLLITFLFVVICTSIVLLVLYLADAMTVPGNF